MTKGVYVLGGYQTDFARNWAREGSEVGDLMAEAVSGAADECGVSLEDTGSVHIGNFVAELFCHQGILGGVLAEAVPELAGIPASRHEAACASGSMAALAGMTAIQAGHHPLVCVAGVELMRNVDGKTAADYLGAAAWRGHEAQDAAYCWPFMFDQLSLEYEKRYGLDYRHVARIAELNYENGRRNPNAQTRHWAFNDASFTRDDQANPVINGWVRRNDCGQITDGAACVFLASEEYARDYARKRGLALADIPRILGWGTRTMPISLKTKFEQANSNASGLVFPHVRNTIDDAMKRAGVGDVFELSAIETHDCFAITEYMAIDHFGITAPGESWRAVEEGIIAFDGRLPINTSGGLIGCGHPVGATGVRMMLDCCKQLTGQAGDYQVHGANKVAMLNIGGSATTTACFILGKGH